ncbi:MAG: cob(I)yrinic acid a,c-diamide adenosyltransferase [Dehalococcoidia bacterium]|nr:cob(I)yrinic acid a,c-diamide adenosyltransferase [Dehalococcoidia bacterium]
MVRINRVYTRAGDDGSTALGGGQRVAKESLRIETYGTVDELNSTIGLVLVAKGDEEIAAALGVIQQELFNLGSDLAIVESDKQRFAVPRIEDRHVKRLEELIDGWNEHLEPLTSFILPGGSPAAAHLHLARTVCRRAERLAVGLGREEEIGGFVIPYLNRLSDLFFVASRLENHRSGHSDVLWDSRAF